MFGLSFSATAIDLKKQGAIERLENERVRKLDAEAVRTCKQTSDCEASCSLGGVSKDWYNKNLKRISECDDGCAGWGNHVKCHQGKCTIFDEADNISKGCNGGH